MYIYIYIYISPCLHANRYMVVQGAAIVTAPICTCVKINTFGTMACWTIMFLAQDKLNASSQGHLLGFRHMFAKLALRAAVCSQAARPPGKQQQSCYPVFGSAPSPQLHRLSQAASAQAAIGTPFGLHKVANKSGPYKSAMALPPQAPLAVKLTSHSTTHLPPTTSQVKGNVTKAIHKPHFTKGKGTAPAPRRKTTKAKSCKGMPQIPPSLPDSVGNKPAIGGSSLSITQWLENMRLERLQGATWKRGKLFVDLFSGERSPVGRQVAQRGGAYIAFDVLIDERFDLGNPEAEQVLMSWMRKGWIWGVWLGTDCTTWSLASYSKGLGWFNSYRTRQNLWGEMAKLTPTAKAKVLEGNTHAQFTIRVLLQVANQPLVVAGLENPAGSVIWHLPELQALGKRDRVFNSTCHYCQYGTQWKKPTRFLFVGCAQALAPCKMCKQSGQICSRTKKAHLKLGHGRCHPSSGKVLTKLATQYPPKLTVQLVDCLAGPAST